MHSLAVHNLLTLNYIDIWRKNVITFIFILFLLWHRSNFSMWYDVNRVDIRKQKNVAVKIH